MGINKKIALNYYIKVNELVRNLTALEKASERKTIELVPMQKEKEKIRRPRKKWLLLSPAAKVCAITQVREEIEMVKVERTSASNV